MSWLEKLPFRRGNTAVTERGEIAAHDAVPEKQNPPLMLLVNDASGRASFKTHVFDSAEAATDFVLYWFPKQAEGGILAFWAMTQEPLVGLDNAGESEVEALVMIRDVNRDGVVYLFSFVDMISAQDFLRQEVQHGTDLGLMMLYWAVPVRMSADQWGRMMLTPSTPPGSAPEIEPDGEISDTWSPPPPLPEDDLRAPAEEPPDVFEEAPNARTGVADPMGDIDETFELTSWMDRPRRKRQQASVDERLGDGPKRAPRRRISSQKPEDRVEPVFEFDDDLMANPPDFITAREPERAGTAGPELAPVPAEFAAAGIDAATEGAPAVEAWTEAESADNAFEDCVAQTEIVEAENDVEPAVEPEQLWDQSAEAQEEVAPSAEDAAGESAPAPDPVPQTSPAEVDGPDELEPEVLRKKMRARTNGNGHKPLPAGGQTNGPASNHLIAEVHLSGNDNGSSPEEGPEVGETRAEVTLEAPAPESDAAPEQPSNGHVDDTIEIRIDIHLSSAKNLKVKRWEVKEEPFEGFNSPPGRF